jgi:hypothetical protein
MGLFSVLFDLEKNSTLKAAFVTFALDYKVSSLWDSIIVLIPPNIY